MTPSRATIFFPFFNVIPDALDPSGVKSILSTWVRRCILDCLARLLLLLLLLLLLRWMVGGVVRVVVAMVMVAGMLAVARSSGLGFDQRILATNGKGVKVSAVAVGNAPFVAILVVTIGIGTGTGTVVVVIAVAVVVVAGKGFDVLKDVVQHVRFEVGVVVPCVLGRQHPQPGVAGGAQGPLGKGKEAVHDVVVVVAAVVVVAVVAAVDGRARGCRRHGSFVRSFLVDVFDGLPVRRRMVRWCCAVLCNVMQRNSTQGNAMQCNATQNAIQRCRWM